MATYDRENSFQWLRMPNRCERTIFFLFSLFFFSAAFAQGPSTPSSIDHLPREMKTAGFWISHHPSPDLLIMDADAIVEFNQRLSQAHLIKDIFDEGGAHNRRYGLVVHFANQRFSPTNNGLAQNDFDPLQNSGLDVGTPVVVVRTSDDGRWYYVLTDISDGWVEARTIALGTKTQVEHFAKPKDFIVVVSPKADIFLNEAMTQYDDYVRMGVRLPVSAQAVGHVMVYIPMKDNDGHLVIAKAFMDQEDVHGAFLSYTARTIYKQALRLLHEPYGWGDRDGEQDCSRFLQMIFATVGITLPRDSKDQARAGTHSVDVEKSDDHAKIIQLLKSKAPSTLLVLKGHIMLYLGPVHNNPYVIHETTSLGLNRVIISDLSLGRGSAKGSLLERLVRIVSIE